MRLTEFWRRMDEHFGQAWARSYATDVVISELGGQTISEALKAGKSAKEVWQALCKHDPSIPSRLR